MLRAAEPGERRGSPLSVLDELDLEWISDVLDLVVRAEGQPWRVALDALDAMPVSRRRLGAVRLALARLLGGGSKLAPMARRVRGLVLGRPALEVAARAERRARAAAALGVDDSEIEKLLFIDLRGERPILLPRGRPLELEVAAAANVALIQRALARAHRITLRITDDDGTLLRAARARGLLVTATRDATDGATVLEIVGPLALVQRTAVYGRTLGQLVPFLAASPFELVLESPIWSSRLASPVLLPVAPVDRAGTYEPTKLARGLERHDPELRAMIAPPPPPGAALACPDLAIDHRGVRSYVELVGFWTPQYLARKLAGYGNARVVLCVDAARGCEEDALDDPRILRFTRRPHPGELADRLHRLGLAT
ncbi:MAG: DUF790 family protein [Kofleriaceae bacterium]